MIDYAASQANYTTQRRRLKLALTSKDHERIVRVAEEGLASFDVHGWPDLWHKWKVVRDDALIAIQRESGRF